jgi:hypothetical protein
MYSQSGKVGQRVGPILQTIREGSICNVTCHERFETAGGHLRVWSLPSSGKQNPAALIGREADWRNPMASLDLGGPKGGS